MQLRASALVLVAGLNTIGVSRYARVRHLGKYAPKCQDLVSMFQSFNPGKSYLVWK